MDPNYAGEQLQPITQTLGPHAALSYLWLCIYDTLRRHLLTRVSVHPTIQLNHHFCPCHYTQYPAPHNPPKPVTYNHVHRQDMESIGGCDP